MNRKTGVKVAGFKNIDPDHQRETSFWNATDERIDSSECNLPSHILDVIITDFRSCIKSNYDLGTEETKKMNDERLNGKEKTNSLVYSLRELAGRYDLTMADQPVEEAVPSIEYELTNGGAGV
jgi:cellulose biosynthesis protein BcsQ